jgi:hypothetical protein
MTTKALQKSDLLVNSDYELVVSLDDGGSEDNKQVRRITLKTPKYISKLSNYSTESSISKNLRKDTRYTAEVNYPAYTSSTTYTFNLDDISVDLGQPTRPGPLFGYDPKAKSNQNKCTIILTFSGVKGDIDKKLLNTIQNVANPLYDVLTDLSTGVTVSGKTIKIVRNWNALDPSLIDIDQYTVKNKKWGFWTSDIFKALYSLSVSKNVKEDTYWKAVKNSYIQYSIDQTHKGHTDEATTNTTYSLDTILNTNVPAGIIANTINDYNNGVVDYIYFLVNQGGTKNDDRWWYFDNDLSSITQAANGSRISGNKGYIKIVNEEIVYGKLPKEIGSGNDKISTAMLKNRPISASAKVYSGSASPKDGKYTDDTFPKIPLNIRFAVARYVKGSDNIWRGSWMPNLSKTANKKEVSEMFSTTEIIGAT